MGDRGTWCQCQIQIPAQPLGLARIMHRLGNRTRVRNRNPKRKRGELDVALAYASGYDRAMNNPT